MGMEFGQEVKTSANGSFYVPPFATGDPTEFDCLRKKLKTSGWKPDMVFFTGKTMGLRQ